MHRKAEHATALALDVLVLLGSALFFYHLIPLSHTDLYGHLRQLQEYVQTGIWRPNAGYYVMVWLLAGKSIDFQALSYAASVVLAVSVWLKYRLTIRLLTQWQVPVQAALWLSMSLLVCWIVPVRPNQWLYGQFPPNLWHNSTSIAVMPWVLVLYWLSLPGQRPSPWLLALVIAANAWIKPAFLLAWLPVWVWYNWRAQTKLTVGLACWTCLLLGSTHVVLYAGASGTQLSGQEGGVTIAWMQVWRMYSASPLLSLLLSVPFPLAVALTGAVPARRAPVWSFTAALMAVSVLIFALLAETGDRAAHGNFVWQVIMANYLLYVLCAATWYRQSAPLHPKNIRHLWPGIILAVQVLLGWGYLLRFWFRGNFS